MDGGGVVDVETLDAHPVEIGARARVAHRGDDVEAAPRQLRRDRSADAAAGAGDQRDALGAHGGYCRWRSNQSSVRWKPSLAAAGTYSGRWSQWKPWPASGYRTMSWSTS